MREMARYQIGPSVFDSVQLESVECFVTLRTSVALRDAFPQRKPNARHDIRSGSGSFGCCSPDGKPQSQNLYDGLVTSHSWPAGIFAMPVCVRVRAHVFICLNAVS